MTEQNTFPLIETEVLHERVCFKIPADLPEEELLAVVSAIQAYVKDAQEKAAAWSTVQLNYRRVLKLELYLICDDLWQQQIFAQVLKPEKMYSSQAVFKQWDLDFYRELDRACAFRIATPTNRPAAQAYGIIIGSDAQSLPDLSGMQYATSKPSTCLIFGDESNLQLAEIVAKDCNLNVLILDRTKLSLPELVGAIIASEIVIGPTSLETYFANCFRKGVVEFYPPELNRGWLSKWSNPLYRMLVCKNLKSDQDIEAFKITLVRLWDKLQFRKEAASAARKSSTPMEPSISIATDVQGSSAQ